jgi:hypothetical protein
VLKKLGYEKRPMPEIVATPAIEMAVPASFDQMAAN